MREDPALDAPAYKLPESVLVVIHSADLQVLLLERADRPGYWQSVTGSKARPDETPAQTAVREVAEETGIVVGSDRVPAAHLRDWSHCIEFEIYPVWRHRYAPGVTRNVEHWFSLLVPVDIEVTISPAEHLRHRWLPWRDAAAACFSSSNAEAIGRLPLPS